MLKAQDGTDHQKQFQAAVDVIQRLPKNGPYRPSYEVMLRFYSYYKQATLGRCNISRPGFWDPIGRYKWDAWNGLGDLTQEEAMAAYIREMKTVAQKIIDTVPMEDASSDMFHFFEPLYKMIPDMPRPPEHLFKKINGNWDQNSEFHSTDETTEHPLIVSASAESNQGMDRLAPLGEEQHNLKEEGHQEDPDENTYIVKQLIEEEKVVDGCVAVPLSGHLDLEEKMKSGDTRPTGDTVDRRQVTSDSETELFCDSLDQLELNQDSAVLDSQLDCLISAEGLYPTLDTDPKNSALKQSPSVGGKVVGKGESAELGTATSRRFQISRELLITRDSEGVSLHSEMNIHVAATVRRLQEDMQLLKLRLSHLEAKVAEKKHWWQPLEASTATLLFLVVWPFFAQWLLHKYQSRKK